VDPRAGLDDVEKRKFLTLPGLEPRSLSRPARSQSYLCINIYIIGCAHRLAPGQLEGFLFEFGVQEFTSPRLVSVEYERSRLKIGTLQMGARNIIEFFSKRLQHS
jgi:hypothetical protein